MSEKRNLDWLIGELKFYINVDDTNADQDFVGPSSDTDKWYKRAINQAGDAIIEDAKQHGSYDWFRKIEQFTWAASTVTISAPTVLLEKDLLDMRDVTNDAVGEPLPWSSAGPGSGIFWKDNETLQWGVTGPSAATTVRVSYLADYVDLVNSTDEPTLIPSKYRHILVWKGLDILKALGDEQVPRDFQRHLSDWQERFMAHLSKGRPSRNSPSRIVNRDPDGGDLWGR